MNVTLKLAKTKVPPTETNYYCAMFDLPADDDYHMIAYKPLIDNREVAHHIIIFGCSGSGKGCLNLNSSRGYTTKDCGQQTPNRYKSAHAPVCALVIGQSFAVQCMAFFPVIIACILLQCCFLDFHRIFFSFSYNV